MNFKIRNSSGAYVLWYIVLYLTLSIDDFLEVKIKLLTYLISPLSVIKILSGLISPKGKSNRYRL